MVIVPDQEDRNCDVIVVMYSSPGPRGWVEVRLRLESKGEGTWVQAGDLSGWEFATISMTLVFQVSGFFLIAQ